MATLPFALFDVVLGTHEINGSNVGDDDNFYRFIPNDKGREVFSFEMLDFLDRAKRICEGKDVWFVNF